MTVIDPHLKWILRRKLKQIHEQLRLTLVYVTHDQNEALTFADKVVVMSEGEVLQLGTPQDLFESPAHTFIGHFIGSPGMNFLPCILEGQTAMVGGLGISLLPETATRAHNMTGAMQIGVRPEFLKLSSHSTERTVPVTVGSVEDLGNFQIVTVRLGDIQLKVKVPEDQEVPATDAFPDVHAGANQALRRRSPSSINGRQKTGLRPWKREKTTEPGFWLSRCS